MSEKKMQVRLLRDWVLAENEKFRPGSVGILTFWTRHSGEQDMEVRFADWDAIGWEEDKSCVGYPGFAPVYDWGTEKEMEEQFGPDLYVIEELGPDTIRKFEDLRRVKDFILLQEQEKKTALKKVWERYDEFKKKTRKKWATIRAKSKKESSAKSPKSAKKRKNS
jgi:hypothetical protein